MKRFAVLGLAAALVTLAGCAQSPEARINAACVRDGGLMSDPNQPKPAAAEVKRQCDCFSKNVKETMTPDELKQLADLMNQPKKEGGAGADKMPPAIATKMMGAMKACVIPS